MPVVETPEDDDDVAVHAHICELKKECLKKICDQDKIIRLLSLTHVARREEMLESTAATRVSDTIEKYGILKMPTYVSSNLNVDINFICLPFDPPPPPEIQKFFTCMPANT